MQNQAGKSEFYLLVPAEVEQVLGIVMQMY
jgi:hypothetical protein